MAVGMEGREHGAPFWREHPGNMASRAVSATPSLAGRGGATPVPPGWLDGGSGERSLPASTGRQGSAIPTHLPGSLR